ncbi:hypothetical protein [Rickettsiella endosymbiont of Xylota segnis]
MFSSRDGDFQEEKRDSLFEWLNPSLARASHIGGIPLTWSLKDTHF